MHAYKKGAERTFCQFRDRSFTCLLSAGGFTCAKHRTARDADNKPVYRFTGASHTMNMKGAPTQEL